MVMIFRKQAEQGAQKLFLAAQQQLGQFSNSMPGTKNMDELKESLRAASIEQAKNLGLGENFVDSIADETIGVTEEEIVPFLRERNHPAFNLPPIM